MRIVAAGDGALLRFGRAEGELLVTLFADVAEAMRPGGLAEDDPVQQRLFPAAYDDPAAEQSFQELTGSALRDERIERAEQCLAEVAAAPTRRHGLELRLDADAAERWLRAVNDIRLAFGTRLEITEDDVRTLDPDDPRAGLMLAYAWLGDVLDDLVRALAG